MKDKTRYVSTIKEVKAYISKEGYKFEDKTWVDNLWKIVESGLPKKDKCQFCGKPSIEMRYNLAGEILYEYCQKCKDEIMSHIQTFQILELT